MSGISWDYNPKPVLRNYKLKPRSKPENDPKRRMNRPASGSAPPALTLWRSGGWHHACSDRAGGARGAGPQGTTWTRPPPPTAAVSSLPVTNLLAFSKWLTFTLFTPGWQLGTGVLALLLKDGEGEKYDRRPVSPLSNAQRLSSGPLTEWLFRWITSKNRVGLSCMGLVKIWSR